MAKAPETGYTLAEASAAAGLSLGYLNRLVRDDRLPTLPKSLPPKAGRREPVRVRKEDVVALGFPWDHNAIVNRRSTQATQIVELQKEIEDVRKELRISLTKLETAERRAAVAEAERDMLQWSLRVMKGEDLATPAPVGNDPADAIPEVRRPSEQDTNGTVK